MKRLLLGALLVWSAAAQDTKTLSLSLSKAVEIALAPDGATRTQLALEQVKISQARQAQARSALLPNLDGGYNFQNFTQNLQAFGITFNLPPTIPLQIPTLVGPISVSDYRANATQRVFDLSAIRRYQASKAGVTVARAEDEVARNQTKGSVAKAYLMAVRADAALAAAKANVELAERLLKLARNQKESGTGTGIDVTRAQVHVAEQRQQVIAAKEDRDAARLGLIRAMNLNMGVELDLTDTLAYQPVEIPAQDKALIAAREMRPELKAQADREKVARLNYDSVKWERVPTVGAFGNYGTIGQAATSVLPTYTVGFSIKVPVWDGGRMDARRVESAASLRQEAIRTRDASQQVELEVRLALESIRSAEEQAKVALEALSLSEKELEQAQRRYQAGVASSLEISDAQTRVAQARLNSVSALYKQKAATIDLGLAVGNIDMVLR
jgi:outer membrane protein